MRSIVACPVCRRQYDATGRAPGERLHCSCGEGLVVEEPRGHDAAVVRCSACGGPRTDDDRACAHCGATLTVHERDLHTVCPGCLARISDRAAFCHHCGLAIVPETLRGEETDEPCPACGDAARLRARRFAASELAVSECVRCGGLWVARAVLARLEEEARRAEPPSAAAPPPPASLEAQKGPLYRPCPVCGKLMNRAHYGPRSGVVIDRCHSHGVWFDDDELARVLRYVRAGGGRHAEARAAEARREDARRARFESKAAAPAVVPGRAGGFIPDLLEVLLDAGWSLLRS